MQRLKVLLSLILVCVFSFAGCTNAPQNANNATNNTQTAANKDPNRKIKIGFSMATVREERWQRDRDAFEKHCKELNVECSITVADNNKEKQANDVDNLLTQKVD